MKAFSAMGATSTTSTTGVLRTLHVDSSKSGPMANAGVGADIDSGPRADSPSLADAATLSLWASGDDAASVLVVALFLEDADSVAVRKGTLPASDSATLQQPVVVRMLESALDQLVRLVQPSPKVAHVELAVVDGHALLGRSEAHMATYIMDTAGWRPSDEFYTNRRWLALPIMVPAAAVTMRSLMNSEDGAPYSLAQYVAALPYMQWVAGAWHSSRMRSSAHCATLSTRILSTILRHSHGLHAGRGLDGAPATYSPSKLYRTLLGLLGADMHARASTHPRASRPDLHRTSRIVTALRKSDDELRALPETDARELLIDACRDVWMSSHGAMHGLKETPVDTTALEHQRNLARLLLRLLKSRQPLPTNAM